MDTIFLEARVRDLNESVKILRRDSLIPASFYGFGEKNLCLKIPEKFFVKVYRQAGENTVIDLNINDGEINKKVIIHEVQKDPVTDQIVHIDFMNVSMLKELTTHIPLEFVGISPAVKDLGGILNTMKSSLKVRCLPQDLVHSISVDISGLNNLHVVLHVKDVNIPQKIKILEDPEEVVVTVVAPKAEVEETPVATETATEAPKEAETKSESSS